MANYIVTNNPTFFQCIGDYEYCSIEDMAQWCQPFDTLACDSETTSLHPRLGRMFSFQIGTGQDNFLIDMQERNNPIHFEQFKHILKNKWLVFHNAQFDLSWLMYHFNYYHPIDKVLDTMLASQLLYNGIRHYRHGFGYVMERELGLDYDKSVQQDIHRIQLTEDKAIRYCWQDTDELVRLAHAFFTKMSEADCIGTWMLHNKYASVLAYVQICGLYIDPELWAEKIEKDLKNLAIKQQIVEDYIYTNLPEYRKKQIDLFVPEAKGLCIELTSQKQVIPVFQALGIDIYDSAEDKLSIQKNIISKSDHEFVSIWLDYNEAMHTVTTFGQNVLDKIEPPNKLYADYRPILDTSRISTRKGCINVLNLPANESTRGCFTHQEGYKLIVADLNAHEARVNAYFTRDEAMVDSVINGADLHCAFTRVLFPELAELDDETISNDYGDKRKKAKAPRFLFQYGGNSFTLHQNENIPLDEAEVIEEGFRQLHAGIYAWGDEIFNDAISTGYIKSTLGFRLALPMYRDYLEQKDVIDALDQNFWKKYRIGKAQYRAMWAYRNFIEDPQLVDPEKPELGYKVWEGDIPEIYDDDAYDTYMDFKREIGDFFKLQAKYKKLCLNNPIQASASHQFKNGVIKLFERILENGHGGVVEISNVVHDEIILHLPEELATMYQPIMEQSMIEGGEELMPMLPEHNGLKIPLEAEAQIVDSWYEGK